MITMNSAEMINIAVECEKSRMKLKAKHTPEHKITPVFDEEETRRFFENIVPADVYYGYELVWIDIFILRRK